MIHIVTIKEKIPLFKGEEKANAIEVVLLNEFGFELVTQMNRFQVGDKALLVEPDYNLPNIPFWADWISPNGDPKKSKLGSNNRIRAIKYNLHKGDGMPVYSNGILLTQEDLTTAPIPDKLKFTLNSKCTEEFLTNLGKEYLGIYKYDPETSNKGKVGKARTTKKLPDGMYRTDEENFNKITLTYPIHLIGSLKIDGSSCSIWKKSKQSGICSRNLQIPLMLTNVIGKKKDIWSKIKSLFGVDISIYKEEKNTSEFITIGEKYLQSLIESDYDNITLRGEIYGKNGSKGSGNPRNPHGNKPGDILFYGVDEYTSSTKKEPYNKFVEVTDNLSLTRCPEIFNKEFSTREELIQECNQYFADNLVEGIVIRTPDSSISAKIMNLEYDSKK